MLFLLCQSLTVIEAHCKLFYKRAAKMNLKPIASLLANKLYNVACSSPANKLSSAIQCIKHEECFYLTIDRANHSCTLYNQGSTSYNTTNLQTYVSEFSSPAVLFVQDKLVISTKYARTIQRRSITSTC